MNRLMPLIAAALTQIGPFAADCAAQQAPTRTPAWVAISEEVADTTGYRLLRRAGSAPVDVILLSPTADAMDLSHAVDALMAIRRERGDAAEVDAMLRVQHRAQRSRALPWAERVLQDAKQAEPRQISSVGRLRAVRIWLPSQRRG